MTALISLITISSLVILAHLFSKQMLDVRSRLSHIEYMTDIAKDGRLLRSMDKLNEKIKKLSKENKELKLILSIKDMNNTLENRS